MEYYHTVQDHYFNMKDWSQSNSVDRRSVIKAVGAAGVATGLGGVEASASTASTQRTRTLLGRTAKETELYINDSGVDGMTTFVVGGMHGNEEAGYLAGDAIKKWTPASGTLVVLPRANTVAIEDGTREANGDLNRQFPLNASPTTTLARAIWGVVTEFDPDLVIDMHESTGRYIDGWLGQSVGYSPVRNFRGAAQVAIDALNNSIDTSKNQFHQRFLPSPAEQPTGVFVQRTAFEQGIPTYIIETYEDLGRSDRVYWQTALVKRLMDFRASEFDATDPHHVLAVDGSGPKTNYQFDVDGTVTATDTVSAPDSVGETHVEGVVAEDIDYYHFTENITNFTVSDGSNTDLTLYVDGEQKTIDELTATSTSELRITSTGSTVEYQLGVDEPFTATPSLSGEDWVFEDRAYGAVNNGEDVYEYKYDIDHFDVTEGDPADLALEIDGEPVAVDELDETPTHDLLIRGVGDAAYYQCSVSGTVSETSLSDSGDAVSTSSISGGVGGGYDLFRFTGEIISFDVLQGSAEDIEILVDGNLRTVAELNPPDVHTLQISGRGPRTGYAFTISDIVYPTRMLSDEDHSRIDRADGAVGGGVDEYLFRGDVNSFTVTDGSFANIDVFIDGEKKPLAELNDVRTLRISGTGSRTGYAFETSGRVYPTDSLSGEDRVEDGRATGAVGGGADEYLFDGEIGSFTVTDGSFANIDVYIDGEKKSLAELNDVRAEARLIGLDEPWQSYGLTSAYESPVVVATPLSFNGPQPCHTRLRNVSRDRFEARVEEWRYMNDVHYGESVGCLAMEGGRYEMDGGSSAEVGRTVADHSWRSVSFEQAFGSVPIVLCQSETEQGAQPILTRIQNVSTDGFDVRLQEEEVLGSHASESLGYIVVEPGRDTVNGMVFEAGRVTLDDNWWRLSFERSYSNPVFLAATQSFNGSNTCGLRYQNLSESGVSVKIEEERSNDEETAHTNETVGYLVLDATQKATK